MQVRLGRGGSYAVRAVLDLARHHAMGRRKAREIAQAMDVPAPYLPQVLAKLVRRGLLVATAGPGGGYTLSRAPADISLLDVIEAAEGPLRAGECLLRDGRCDEQQLCALHVSWTAAEDALSAELARTTFGDLAAIERRIDVDGDRQAPDVHAFRRERRGVRSSERLPRPRDGGEQRKDPDR